MNINKLRRYPIYIIEVISIFCFGVLVWNILFGDKNPVITVVVALSLPVLIIAYFISRLNTSNQYILILELAVSIMSLLILDAVIPLIAYLTEQQNNIESPFAVSFWNHFSTVIYFVVLFATILQVCPIFEELFSLISKKVRTKGALKP